MDHTTINLLKFDLYQFFLRKKRQINNPGLKDLKYYIEESDKTY
jgi:hypothetical protein